MIIKSSGVWEKNDSSLLITKILYIKKTVIFVIDFPIGKIVFYKMPNFTVNKDSFILQECLGVKQLDTLINLKIVAQLILSL